MSSLTIIHKELLMKKHFAICMTGLLLSNISFAQVSREIQTAITSHNGLSVKLPQDGSSCDPTVIAANLQKLRQINVLDVNNLTRTEPANGSCYGACPEDLQHALARHCLKAEKLAEIVNLFQ